MGCGGGIKVEVGKFGVKEWGEKWGGENGGVGKEVRGSEGPKGPRFTIFCPIHDLFFFFCLRSLKGARILWWVGDDQRGPAIKIKKDFFWVGDGHRDPLNFGVGVGGMG